MWLSTTAVNQVYATGWPSALTPSLKAVAGNRTSTASDCPACNPFTRLAAKALSAAGTQGSGNRSLRVQGPNLDQREISYEDALFAIHNGGASGAVMPQNIVVGDDAEEVARFIGDYSGTQVEDSPRPSPEGSGQDSGTGGAAGSSD